MSSLNEHTARWQHHPQPARVPATHWSKTGELHGGVEPGRCGPCQPCGGEFTEDIADASMCICGVPALSHEGVFGS